MLVFLDTIKVGFGTYVHKEGLIPPYCWGCYMYPLSVLGVIIGEGVPCRPSMFPERGGEVDSLLMTHHQLFCRVLGERGGYEQLLELWIGL